MKRLTLSLVLVSIFFLPGMAGADDDAIEKEIKKGPLDRVTIFVPAISKEQPLRIRPFPADNADVGKTGKKKNKEVADSMKESAPPMLLALVIEELKKGGFVDVAELGEDEQADEPTLIVEGEFTVMDPGSRAKRYWAGFGAGKSRVCAEGRVIDTQDRVLMTFDHCRFGVMGFAGGKSEGKMNTDAEQTGSRLADFLVSWAEGRYR